VLRVTNRSDIDLHDRFNGVDVSFLQGQSTIVANEVARHIFGFGDADKTGCLARLGWMRSNQDREAAMARLAKFTFSDANEPDPNEIQPKKEQGLAPLQPGAADEEATDGATKLAAPTHAKITVETDVPIPAKKGARSVLDKLSDPAGA
jgi:hypothetical protein